MHAAAAQSPLTAMLLVILASWGKPGRVAALSLLIPDTVISPLKGALYACLETLFSSSGPRWYCQVSSLRSWMVVVRVLSV